MLKPSRLQKTERLQRQLQSSPAAYIATKRAVGGHHWQHGVVAI